VGAARVDSVTPSAAWTRLSPDDGLRLTGIVFHSRSANGRKDALPRARSAWNPFLKNSRIKPRVLIADDERIVTDTLQLILTLDGFEAAAVYDGQCAVDQARRWHPHIFLTDIAMPVLNGIEAAMRVSRMIPACHILLLSGDAESPDLWHEAYIHGYDFPFLQKPVNPEDLLAHLWEMIAERSGEAS
jgi:CheY-like chemotaxis protein